MEKRVMSKTLRPEPRVVFLGPVRASFRTFFCERFAVHDTREEIARVYDGPLTDITWISSSAKSLDKLLAVSSLYHRATKFRQRHESLLAITPPRSASMPALHGLFELLVGGSAGYRWLPPEQLVPVLLLPRHERSELFLAIATDPVTKTVALRRADLSAIVVPYSLFETGGGGTRPDFSRPRVTDYGRTVAFGDYESAGDAILYETDAEYRKKLHSQRRESEQTFGASLRRLRLQRGLTQDDFPGVAAKTVARIERGEVAKPHGRTLKILAETLDVSPDEIESF
jgi:hypothetical protein